MRIIMLTLGLILLLGGLRLRLLPYLSRGRIGTSRGSIPSLTGDLLLSFLILPDALLLLLGLEGGNRSLEPDLLLRRSRSRSRSRWASLGCASLPGLPSSLDVFNLSLSLFQSRSLFLSLSLDRDLDLERVGLEALGATASFLIIHDVMNSQRYR